jgi:putative FmdB family regulatory protein
MPLYDYFCADCGGFRKMVRMADSAHAQPCPRCAVPAQRILVSPFLAGRGDSGDAPGPRVPGGGGSWRSLCGFGCPHCAGSG